MDLDSTRVTSPQPSAAQPQLETLRCNLALCARLLSRHGHDDFNQGQVSARIPGRDALLIKSGWVGFDSCEPKDLLELTMSTEGKLGFEAPAETCLHRAIYRSRPDVRAIVHTHHEATVAFGAVCDEMLPISHEGAFFSGNLGFFDETSQTVLTEHHATGVADKLGAHSAVILRNHGFVAVGSSVKSAAIHSMMLTRACRVQLLALSSGRPLRASSSDDIAPKRKFIYSDTALRGYWNSLMTTLVREQPDIAAWAKPNRSMVTLHAALEGGSVAPPHTERATAKRETEGG